jgi:hypothetical protein
MATCSYCSNEELLPFTCSYCNEKFCRRHHLPEKHSCKGLTKAKWQSKKFAEKTSGRSWSSGPSPPTRKKGYEIPGVMEVIERATGKRKKPLEPGYFDIDEKLIVASILILILILGIISRFF